ncbi:MAG: SoxR reducing system RseC family protein [Bacteroidales bacterium]|nr:SoxR reducing system RseC family protein [Bacteroidales bacterium]
MNQTSCIEQNAVIENITGSIARVKFNQHASCGSCSAKEICGSGENSENTVEVDIEDNGYLIGDQVILSMKRTLALRAVLLAYVLPFVLLIATLVLLGLFKVHEAITGLASLLVLVPYFIFLARHKDYLKKTFIFSIRKAHS